MVLAFPPMVAQHWWAEARLWLSTGRSGPVQLGRGSAVDMIALALASAGIEQEDIFLRIDGVAETMGWSEIVAAAGRTDFPIII
jgi:hypothetical protein